MVITEKDLMNIAGWECIKEAKQLLDLDSVKAVNMNKGDSFPLIITGFPVLDKTGSNSPVSSFSLFSSSF